ncbi:RICIN domain-containing protein [Kitasatospora aureofaciens]|uniref:RICIN domain-containing protein n=1 Tax=Kitasatospora aureofaciens TaxID=1894 RepID=UPI00068F35D8|nr:RICIN domain-containing protein [Kitasatospora aureofaciens]
MAIGIRLPRGFAALGVAALAAAVAVPLTASPAAAVNLPICLSGNLQYDYQSAEAGTSKPTMTKPVRNANVQLWGAENSTDIPRQLTLDYQYTGGADGSFNLCYTPITTTSMSSLWVQFTTEDTKLWKVSNSAGTLYTLKSTVKNNISTSTNLGIIKPSAADARAWHAFDTVNLLYSKRNNLLSSCWSARELNSAACTELNVQWYANSADGPYYTPGNNTVHLSAADPDSEHTVLHESGHFFMNRLYNGFPAVTNCSPHYIQLVSSGTCAWTEGFADSTAAYLLGDYRYVWSDGSSYPFTYTSGWNTGDQVQGNVDGSLLDLWNNVDGGWNSTISLLTTNTPSTFAAYWANRATAVPPLATSGAALSYLANHAIDYGPTIVADNQYHALTNGGGLALEHAGQCATTTNVVADLNTYDPTHASERWKLDTNTDGTTRIYDSCPTPLTLTAPTTAGAQATLQAPDSTSQYQKWQVTKNSSGTYTITNPATGYALDSIGVSTGATVTVNPANSANTQNWATLS